MADPKKAAPPADKNVTAEPEQTKLAQQKKRKAEIWRSIKFLLFSISAGAIELGSVTLLDAVTPWRHFYCYLIGLILSVLWNFTFNRKFTFKSANNIPLAMFKVACYYAVFTPTTTWLDKILTENKNWPGILSTIMIMVINFVTEYIYDRFFVFGKTLDTNDIAQKQAGESGDSATDKSAAASGDTVADKPAEAAAEGAKEETGKPTKKPAK